MSDDEGQTKPEDEFYQGSLEVYQNKRPGEESYGVFRLVGSRWMHREEPCRPEIAQALDVLDNALSSGEPFTIDDHQDVESTSTADRRAEPRQIENA